MSTPVNTKDLDVVSLFQEAVYEVEGHRVDGLALDTELADLSLSSVTVMEILGHLEQRLDIRFADEDLSRLTKLRDLETLILKARGSSS